VTNKEEIQSTNCPLCGKDMMMVHDLKDFSIQFCHTHGVFVVDKPTNDTWALEGFDNKMIPIKRKWYTIDNFKPLTLDQYRDMVKNANFRRLQEK
jgi:hypothetical protein